VTDGFYPRYEDIRYANIAILAILLMAKNYFTMLLKLSVSNLENRDEQYAWLATKEKWGSVGMLVSLKLQVRPLQSYNDSGRFIQTPDGLHGRTCITP